MGWWRSLTLVRLSRRAGLVLILLIAAQWPFAVLTCGLLFRLHEATNRSVLTRFLAKSHAGSIVTAEAPSWGRLQYVPITVSAPQRFFMHVDPKRYNNDWYFPEISRAEFAKILDGFGLSAAIQQQLIEASDVDLVLHRRRVSRYQRDGPSDPDRNTSKDLHLSRE